MQMLIGESLSLAYYDGDRTTHAVQGASIEIPATGFVGVMGPSGSGKSSLLYLLSGLKRPTSGDVSITQLSNYPITQYSRMSEHALTQLRRQRFGFVFQQPFLLNYLTARENVLAAAPRFDSSADARIRDLFERLDIAELANRFPAHLSGGERQRVCVARAMVNEPAVIFADEPTASLDHANGHIVISLLSSYRTRGVLLVVTHDAEMLRDADTVVQMRDGAIVDRTVDVARDTAI